MDASCPRACEAAAGPSAEAVALCVRWAAAGECVANTAFMREQCTEQCTCEARAAHCSIYRIAGQLAATASELDLSDFERRCIQALKLQGCQEHAARAAELLQQQRLRQQQRQQQELQTAQCDGWAEAGECERNPEWMLASCAKECADRDPRLPPCPPPRRRGRAAPPPPPCGTAAPPWRSGIQLGASFSFRNEVSERVELLWVDDATDLEVQSATLQPHAPEAATSRARAATSRAS